MSNEKKLNIEDGLNDRRSLVENFVTANTGFKKAKKHDTMLISDYVIENDTITFKTRLEEEASSFFKDYKYDILIGLYYIFLLVFTANHTRNLITSISWLDIDILGFNYLTFFFFVFSPILVWLASTNTKFWQFHSRKLFSLGFVGLTIVIRLTSTIYIIFYRLFIPYIFRIEITPEVTANQIVGLGYLVTIIPTVVAFILISLPLKELLFNKDNRKDIKEFKLKHYLDLSKSNPYAYDSSIVTNMETGKKHVIKEHDRYMHTEITGATGTAKTSSCILPAINEDLNTKVKNEDAQKKAVVKMLKEGKVYLTKPIEDEEFNINYVRPNPGYEKELKEKVLKYRSAGVTALAPDDSLPDNIYELTKAKGIKCNRIDPRPNPDGSPKEGFIGFNPLYISPTIPEWSRKKEIIKRATLFADVMQIIYEMSGKSDPYFSSINRIATTTVSILLCVTYPLLHNGNQPTVKDVQNILNNFEKIKPYYQKLLEIDDKDEYLVIKDVIRNDFIGPGREKFEDHSRGLRVQLNNFIMDPLVEKVLCAEKSIDLDKALADGEVTVCNIELGDLGPINSPAFGLFFSISFLNAVLRRPGDEFTRLPHFWYIDEFPVIVSPSLESCFSLFRKFRVAMTVALQTFDQLNKNPFLEYLKGVIINSCAHHIIFGRANPNDMELFSSLGGIVEDVMAQQTYSQTSITTENPSFSESVRYTPQREQFMEPAEVRNKDFQELTFFTVDRGRPLKPIHGRVFFLRDVEKKKKKRYRVDWKKLMLKQTVITKSVSTEETAANEEHLEVANKALKEELVKEGTVASTVAIKTDEEISATATMEDKDSIVKSKVASTVKGTMDLLEEDDSDKDNTNKASSSKEEGKEEKREADIKINSKNKIFDKKEEVNDEKKSKFNMTQLIK